MRHKDFDGPLHGLRESMNGRYPKIGDRVRCQDMCNGKYYSGVVTHHARHSHYDHPVYVVNVNIVNGKPVPKNCLTEWNAEPPEFVEILEATDDVEQSA